MPELSLYHLTPNGPFHLSLRGVGQEKTDIYLPSDSLFAALLATYQETGGNIEKLVEAFPLSSKNGEGKVVETNPSFVPFLLTSTFPRAGGVRFYPAPPALNFLLSTGKLKQLEELGQLKSIKKIQFLSEGLFERMVKGEKLDAWLPVEGVSPAKTGTNSGTGIFLQGTTLWLTREETQQLPEALLKDRQGKPIPLAGLRYVKVWQESQVPRVTVDRISNASEIFYTGRVTFNHQCGWWLGLAWNQGEAPTIRPEISKVLALLADAGLGGERTAGYGQFTCEDVKTIRRWPDPKPEALFLTLSRYHPRQSELPETLQAGAAAYKLVSVGGWLNAPRQKAQRRKRLWLLTEGSVIRAVGPGPWGNVVDVKPEYPGASEVFPHPVWRYGLACPVALKGEMV